MTEHISKAEWRKIPCRKPRVEREHKEQATLFKWARLMEKHIPELALLFAIPNGGHRNKATVGKLKAEGVKAGVPDICLPVACGQYHGLFIELKAEGGRPTDAQRNWLLALNAHGYATRLCFGWEDARKTIDAYLKFGPPLGEGVE